MNFGNGPQRDWADARAKTDEEGCCRNCRKRAVDGAKLETDHTIGRKYDQPMVCVTCRGSSRRLAGAGPCTRCKGRGYLKTLYVKPAATIPLCDECHRAKHRGEIDLLPLLHLDEQLYAVEMLGGVALAYDRLTIAGAPQ